MMITLLNLKKWGLVFFLLVTTYVFGLAQSYAARHGMSSATYQEKFDKYKQQGYRLTLVSGYSDKGQARFAAIWEKKSGPEWTARHNMSSAGYQKAFDDNKKKGYRLILVDGYTENGQARFAAIWAKIRGAKCAARHDMTSAEYQQNFDKYKEEGYRLTHVSAYSHMGTTLFAAIWEKKKGPKWRARHNMTSSVYQNEFNDNSKQGYRLKHVSGYSEKGQARFAAIWEKTSGPSYGARHGLSHTNYQNEFDNFRYQGYRIRKVDGYSVSGKPMFAAIWERKSNGMKPSDLSVIHNKVQTFMAKYKVPGLSIAFSKDDRLVFARGYGYADKKNGIRTSPKLLFRIASVSKPITSATIMQLMQQGKLSLSDTVFGKKGILGKKYGKKDYREYVKDITVQNLLEHTAGGWAKNPDPMRQHQNKFSRDKLISWVLDHRKCSHCDSDPYLLEDEPGTHYAYSNFGFCLLGRVIEKITKQPYVAYVRKNVLKQCGISDMHIGLNKKSQKRPNEVVYYGQGGGKPYSRDVTRMDSHGGWIASSIDLLRFAVRVDGFNTKPDILTSSTITTMTTPSTANQNYAKGWRVNPANNWWHTGALDGTASILVRANNGFCWAVLLNTFSDKDGFSGALDDLPWDIINNVSYWPPYDLF